MTPDEIRRFIVDHDVKVVPKSESRLMRFIAWFCSVRWFWLFQINPNFLDGYVTTIGKTIYYRSSWGAFSIENDADIRRHSTTFEHEFMHVEQYERWWFLYQASYLLFPLPFLLAWFRFYWERQPYLHVNMKNGMTVDECANALWKYGWPWPRTLMKRWFEKNGRKAGYIT